MQVQNVNIMGFRGPQALKDRLPTVVVSRGPFGVREQQLPPSPVRSYGREWGDGGKREQQLPHSKGWIAKSGALATNGNHRVGLYLGNGE